MELPVVVRQNPPLSAACAQKFSVVDGSTVLMSAKTAPSGCPAATMSPKTLRSAASTVVMLKMTLQLVASSPMVAIPAVFM